MAFAQTAVLGHIYLFEIPTIFILFLFPLFINKKDLPFRITFLDFIVFAYALFNLVSVCIGIESLYESARYYRAMVLSPVLVYIVIRYASIEPRVIKTGFYLIAFATLVQSFFFIQYYLIYGVRPGRDVAGAISSPITISYLFCVACAVFFFQRETLKSRFRRILSIALSFILAMAVVVSSTRVAFLGLIFTIPIAKKVWHKLRLRKIMTTMVVGTVFLALVVIFSTATINIEPTSKIKDEKTIRKSVERLFTPDLYMKDLKGRMDFWRNTMQMALKNPVFGSGSDKYAVEHRGKTRFKLSSVHNFLLSAIIVSGFPGLLILLLMIIYTYKCLNKVYNESPMESSIGIIVMVSFTILIMISMSNDLSGGRVTLFFFLMAIAARLSFEKRKLSANKYQLQV
jgi:O-antigen ligase